MHRRRLTTALLGTIVLAAGLVPLSALAAGPPLPSVMAAVGDSISQAASTGGTLGADAPQNSWSTGTNSTVNSHYLRLLAAGAPVSGRNYNRSVSGAKVADLAGQMQNVVALSPQANYLTVEIGGNDLCTDTIAQMTSVADFQTRFQSAMQAITTGSPGTYVYVVSIPDAYQLWNLYKSDFFARVVWASAGVCQSLLANPTSTQHADVQRRATFRQRNIAYNTVLADVCAAYANCRYDGNTVFNGVLQRSDVAGDYFHPSLSGQAKLAAMTWSAGYTFGSTPPPPGTMHVAALSGTSSAGKGSWNATVTVTMRDGGGALVAGSTVTGGWDVGGSSACTTSSAGTCAVTLTGLNGKKVSRVTFTVTSATHATLTYAAADNAVTSITVTR